ncbi:hypothetical protein AAF712_003344 [Marasmius tenuissimus]|uniref:Uncharacterized protein n=1 Tax=Marasmius tenuissimus TaxID=585030 RepID=A0ABR3A703_9AGAR
MSSRTHTRDMSHLEQPIELAEYLEVRRARRTIDLPLSLDKTLRRTFQSVKFEWEDLDGLHWSSEDESSDYYPTSRSEPPSTTSSRDHEYEMQSPGSSSSRVQLTGRGREVSSRYRSPATGISHIPFPVPLRRKTQTTTLSRILVALRKSTVHEDDDCPTPMPSRTTFAQAQAAANSQLHGTDFDYDGTNVEAVAAHVHRTIEDVERRMRKQSSSSRRLKNQRLKIRRRDSEETRVMLAAGEDGMKF